MYLLLKFSFLPKIIYSWYLFWIICFTAASNGRGAWLILTEVRNLTAHILDISCRKTGQKLFPRKYFSFLNIFGAFFWIICQNRLFRFTNKKRHTTGNTQILAGIFISRLIGSKIWRCFSEVMAGPRLVRVGTSYDISGNLVKAELSHLAIAWVREPA